MVAPQSVKIQEPLKFKNNPEIKAKIMPIISSEISVTSSLTTEDTKIQDITSKLF